MIKFKNIDFEKKYYVVGINSQDDNFIKKLKNIGIYKDQTIVFKKIGNYKNIIGIEVNGIITVLRINDVTKIIVGEKK